MKHHKSQRTLRSSVRIIVFIIVAGACLARCAGAVNNPTTTDREKQATFVCRSGKSIHAIFYPGDDRQVDLKLSDGRSLSVPRAISASGARYATADESFVFWNKGTTAFITEGSTDHETYSDCVAE